MSELRTQATLYPILRITTIPLKRKSFASTPKIARVYLKRLAKLDCIIARYAHAARKVALLLAGV